MTTEKNKIEALTCHGVYFRKMPEKGTAQGDCPFCGKENHFFCHVSTGKWQCKVCHKEGNSYTFLQEHYDACLKDTKKADYDMLSSQRDGLPGNAFRNHRLAYDRARHTWLYPIRNADKALVNLLRWDYHAEKRGPFSTTTCKTTHLYRGEYIKAVGPIWICEGPGDADALDYMFEKAGVDPATNSVVAKISAGTNLEHVIDQLKGRDIYLLYDNDSAGVDAMTRDAHYLEKKAKSVHVIHWPAAYAEGYDVRDFVTERLNSPKKFFKELQGLFAYTEKVPKKNLPKVPDFPTLVKQFRRVLHLEQNQVNALAVCTAVVASSGTKGTPLWMFLVGPPGSGKSEMLLAFSQLQERCLFLSRLTSEALISGFGGGEDPSIMSYLNNRCLVVKDFTSVKAMSQEKQVDLFGLLRDAYDGEVAKPFGNDVGIREYKNCWFPMLAGVTHVIHADNQSAYGERFLKFELLDDDHDVMKQTQASMAKAAKDGKSAEPDETLKNAIIAFFDQKPLDRSKLPEIEGTKYDPMILALAQVVAVIRTSAERKGNVYAYRPIPENPGRLGSQFIKLSQYLCWVLDKKKMDDEIFDIVRKTAMDTVVSWSLEIIRALIKHPKGLTITDMTRELQVAMETIRPHLDTLCQIIYPYGKKNHGPVIQLHDEAIGHNGVKTRRFYQLDPRFIALWKQAQLHGKPKVTTRRKPTRGPRRGTTYNTRKAS